MNGASKPMVRIVEDEAPLVTMLRYNLERQGMWCGPCGRRVTRWTPSRPDPSPRAGGRAG